VGTVDSFQGQERDIIAITLTRSNPQGEIGFLSDIRRMNVGMTRARRKLLQEHFWELVTAWFTNLDNQSRSCRMRTVSILAARTVSWRLPPSTDEVRVTISLGFVV
jgi:superfamily I DNA and/or RNA helicase